MSTIIGIHEAKWGGHDPDGGWETSYEGWEVITDDQTVRVGISNGQDCCEVFGYAVSEDDPAKFVGAELLRIERVTLDEGMGTFRTRVEGFEYGLEDGGAVFVNVVTDRGNFQITVYNMHNGYYGHEAVVISRDLNISETV